jgi:hypothetical protein
MNAQTEQLSDEQLAFREQMAAVHRPIRPGSVPFAGDDRSGMPPREELGRAERRAILGVLPRRSLWPELQEHDQHVEELAARQGEVEGRLRDLRAQRVNAPSADAQAAADWEFTGRHSPRPESTVERIDAEIADAERERNGVLAAVDRALEDRGAFVTKNRERLAAVAGQQADAVLGRLFELLDELAQARDTLAELRACEVWARLYPSDQAAAEPRTRMFGGGLRHVMEPLGGLDVQIENQRVIDTLRADGEWLRQAAASNEQRALLEGRDARRPDGTAWADSREHKSERQAEIEASMEAFRVEWGRPPKTEIELAGFLERTRNGA